ncbi:LOW QUALITY PROTEIN: extensin-like [Rousettus aegyptiacus]|uniref:LOW QUALITY PROTEIN: extensin-like n=1 Tax=Rousettus aegyptiacus TaxID=9407 RepID=UPI0007894BB8|nr:LOW QUALITY PROTEIN: extensin-like [Rousettus aegyptiacus]
MPPAMAATRVSLRELADLAIGTPEVGAVNFTALHTLIVAMLKNLHLQDTQVDFHSLSPEESRSSEALRASFSSPQVAVIKERRRSSIGRTPVHTLENQVKDLGAQVQDLSRQLRTMESHVQSVVTHLQHFTPQTVGLSIDTPEWLGEQEVVPPIPGMATPISKMATPMPGIAMPTPRMPMPMPGMATATPTPRMPTPGPAMATPMTRMPMPMPGMATATPMPRMRTPVPGMATPMPRMTMLPPEAQIGVTKIGMDSPQAMDMIQNVIEDVKTLKEAHEKAQEDLREFPELMPQVRATESPPLPAQPVYTEAQTPKDSEPTKRRAKDLSE